MKKTINLQSLLSKHFLYVGAVVAILFVSLFMFQTAQAMITSSLDLGDRGADVTELQTYLATSASIYPSGLVTGYFGQLTKAAVERFQTAQGIVSAGTPATTGYGRVGPTTMARINSLLGSGGSQVYWDTVPILNNLSVQVSSNSATLSWLTNEPTQGQVYYSTMPLTANEATGPRQQPYVSGSSSVDGGNQTNHTITIPNLQSNTTYYYLTRAVDNVGNMSMTWPNTFRTN
ncbi:MAG: hypothetical protein A2370_00260 [Candidatus Vogelbacteria bacterium RIFOXYB1_FULL_42_16]|uniref:Fibronectin type-III domain-containing protein n=2 Tax=Candidatus Vogeliibacteriota TaxID=1817922 RepID=A0A1G2QFG8_9BACT|nr:MAG: hypothetical protein A2370_00260 [Candidatus Vogelbacteria bacterium RIFOXYB1_FULL_42_16]OHA60467.1 MAG: hypothetical protein A2607_00155 [Candidatus Vogelbacteria bacterium RIFOXYD1_FULL_42_15]